MIGLEARVRTAVAEFELDASLSIPRDGTVALLGPNGSGKTTFIRALAGLQPLHEGEIVVHGKPWTRCAAGIDLTPQQRSAAIVFQGLALFPRMSAVENVAYGLRSRGSDKREAHFAALRCMERLGIADLADRRAASLSGGEAQKVALARALVLDAELLLLDEPMSSLDAESRSEARAFLVGVLRDAPGLKLVVTHDPVDAFVLADELAIMEHGRIVQTGTPAAISARPRSRYAAEVAGMNLVRGTVERGEHTVIRTQTAAVIVAGDELSAGTEAFAAIHPSGISLFARPPEGSARNVFPVTIKGIETFGGRARIRLTGPLTLIAEVVPETVVAMGLAPGSELWASVKATDIDVYPVS